MEYFLRFKIDLLPSNYPFIMKKGQKWTVEYNLFPFKQI